jgi:hypothetical protein
MAVLWIHIRFNADSDLTFFVNAERIHGFDDKKLKKIYSFKIKLLIWFLTTGTVPVFIKDMKKLRKNSVFYIIFNNLIPF